MFAVHDTERVGPKLLAKILKDAGIQPADFNKLA